MTDYTKLVEDLRARRDELRLQIHLGTKEAQDEFARLEEQLDAFARKAGLDETAEGLGEALSSVGDELVKGYERLKKAL